MSRMEIIYLSPGELKPYENNPRMNEGGGGSGGTVNRGIRIQSADSDRPKQGGSVRAYTAYGCREAGAGRGTVHYG